MWDVGDERVKEGVGMSVVQGQRPFRAYQYSLVLACDVSSWAEVRLPRIRPLSHSNQLRKLFEVPSSTKGWNVRSAGQGGIYDWIRAGTVGTGPIAPTEAVLGGVGG